VTLQLENFKTMQNGFRATRAAFSAGIPPQAGIMVSSLWFSPRGMGSPMSPLFVTNSETPSRSSVFPQGQKGASDNGVLVDLS
jgi:hypothetical protein